MTLVRRALLALALAASTTAVGAATTGAPAAAAEGKIGPGVQMYTDGAQCTGNFVFTDRRDRTYVGYAAHCAGLGAATDTNGCRSRSLPLGTRVSFREGGTVVDGGTRLGGGRLAYSSWHTMDRLGTTGNPCAYNDFALVRVARAAVDRVDPTVPIWGGPTGIDRDGTAEGDQVYSYGSSSLRPGETLSPRTGVSLGDDPRDGGWSHPVYTATPGVPGDSGSGFLSEDGKAVGTLSTLGLLPLPASNNLGDLARELRFAQRRSGIAGLRLVRGTEPFAPSPVPAP